MIRCAWCRAKNYSIDIWCSRCNKPLDWQPPAGTRLRAAVGRLASWAGTLGVGMAVGLGALAWFNGSLGLPSIRLTDASSAALTRAWHEVAAPPPPVPVRAAERPLPPSQSAAGTAATPSPDATGATPPADSAPSPGIVPLPYPSFSGQAAANAPAVAAPGGDPLKAINQFYTAVAAHRFSDAAAMWSQAMQLLYPPSVYIDQRFSATEQIGVTDEHVVSDQGGVAVVGVNINELAGGTRQSWTGTWRLVLTPGGWLLDRPDLQAG